MKRILAVFVVCLLLYPSVTMAAEVNEIAISQTTGSTASYDNSTGLLTWSSGISGYAATYGGGFVTFDDVNLVAGFTLENSGVSGGLAWAEFDLNGTWSVELYDNGGGYGKVLSLSGTLNDGRFGGQYWEDERLGENAVDGKAWVNVSLDYVNDDWVDDKFSGDTPTVGNGVFGLQTGIFLDAAFDNYGNDDYDSTAGFTLTLWGHEQQVVPEPATVALLTFGALVLTLRRKR